VAIITGGTTGIGHATAQRLKGAGATVILLSDRPKAHIDEVCQSLAGGLGAVIGCPCDVRSRSDTQAAVDQILARFQRIDILVNNAGVVALDAVCERDADAFKLMVDVNVHGTYNMIVAVLPAMKARKSGAIVNITSAAAIRGPSGQACYAATKAAILALTHTLPQELRGMGIRVTAIGPGAVRTAMTAAVHTPQTDIMREVRARIADVVPSPDPDGEFVLEPQHIANIAFWLCTDQSWGVHGSMILADNGLSNSWSALLPGQESLS
jgi:NAD(P)-dependent dehydrogenase (short-subunit alcohol dehydrogenase family)